MKPVRGRQMRISWAMACGALAAAVLAGGAVAASDYAAAWGPPVGTALPEIAALDQHNAERNLSNLSGERGLLLFAVRSADW